MGCWSTCGTDRTVYASLQLYCRAAYLDEGMDQPYSCPVAKVLHWVGSDLAGRARDATARSFRVRKQSYCCLRMRDLLDIAICIRHRALHTYALVVLASVAYYTRNTRLSWVWYCRIFCSALSNATSARGALPNLACVILLDLLLARLVLPDTQADKGTQGEQAYHPPPHHYLTQPQPSIEEQGESSGNPDKDQDNHVDG